MQSYTRVTDLQKIRTAKNNDRHNSEIRDSCPEIYIFLLLISYIISSFSLSPIQFPFISPLNSIIAFIFFYV